MSYCRFAPDSDVYMYYGVGGFTFLANLPDKTQEKFQTPDLGMALYKLRRLQKLGCKVPQDAFDRLLKEHKELVEEAHRE